MKLKELLFVSMLIIELLIISTFIPLTDTSEARYATIAKTMVENRNILAPQVWIDGKLVPFMGKPPFGFWIMAASMKIFGVNELAARLPSILSFLFLLGIMFYVLKRYSTGFIAKTAFLISATTAPLFLLANTVLVDGLLALFSIGSLFFYYAFLQEKELRSKKHWSMLVFVFLSFAFITKGPVGLIYFGVPVFFWTLLSGKWETLKYHAWLIGAIVFALVTVTCFLAAEHGMPGFLEYFFIHENILRFTTPNYGDLYSSVSHKLFPGVAIPMALGACAPWILFPIYKALIYISKEKGFLAKYLTKTISLTESVAIIREKCSSHDTLFPVGIMSLAFFWSFSSHIMFYYMILVAPLFGIWCASIMRICQIRIERIMKLSIALLVLYLLASILLMFFLDNFRSSRDITKKAVSICNQYPGNDMRILFVRRIPYSGYFYGGSRILTHDKESVEKSIEEGFNHGAIVFIIEKKYFKRVPHVYSSKLKIEAVNGGWVCFTLK